MKTKKLYKKSNNNISSLKNKTIKIGKKEIKLRNKVTSLPGLNKKLPSNLYVSYINLPNTKKNIHYWFVEAEKNPKNAPIFFWSNGGPGCSGLMGLFDEIGPYRNISKDKLSLNPYSWTKLANIVFMEQPVGVGFSFSENKSDLINNDINASKDNLSFLIEFFKIYPEFSKNKIYLTSESYGGHYMPMMAYQLIKYNNIHNNIYNFKGIIIMNPMLEYRSGLESMSEIYWGHQKIPIHLWKKFKKNSCKNKLNSNYCKKLDYKIQDTVGKVNPYAIDYPLCLSNQENKLLEYSKIKNKTTKRINYDACLENYTTNYLNKPSIKNIVKSHKNKSWNKCSNTVKYRRNDVKKSMKKYFEYILNNNNLKDFKILIMSGTNDSICGTVGTQKFIDKLNLHVYEKWKQNFVNREPIGYTIKYKPNNSSNKLILATVNLAGHEIPMYKPVAAFNILNNFLNNKL